MFRGNQKQDKTDSIEENLLEQCIQNQNADLDKKLENLQNQKKLIELDSHDSDEEQVLRIQQQLVQIKKQIKQKKRIRKKNSKIVVGTNFGFDITDYFKFKKKKDLKSTGDALNIFEAISGSHLSWIILLYSVINAAIIPAWTMNIAATKFLRISWRFLLQTLMIVPFVLYEKRSKDQQISKKYQISYIFDPIHLKKAYVSAFSTSFYFAIILTTFQWTSISHSIVLSGLTNFFLSLGRTSRNNGHNLQIGGQLLIVLGIILIIVDSSTLRIDSFPPESYNYINYFFLTRNQAQRIMADIVALVVAYIMSKFSVINADLKTHYPPFLSMLLVNFFICLNMGFVAYFLNGATFDLESRYGIFSIFTQKHFAGFMYMAIILCMGLVISFVMISKLFPDPLVPGLAMTLQPSISTFMIQISGVQMMPGAFAFIGYGFTIPGNILILIGQWMFQRTHKKQELLQKQRLTQLMQEQSEKQKSLIQKRHSIQMQSLTHIPLQEFQSPMMKKRQTYHQKYKKNIQQQGNKVKRAVTIHHISDNESQSSHSHDMKKKKQRHVFIETPKLLKEDEQEDIYKQSKYRE